ncbi:hypothetical protein [Laceyella putida]|uniref:DUF2637 domain-containing protein n=1 Tax=Laceyella putida TaxID=110101 RepID=A0ABW2RK88_9BACL
MYHKDNHKRDKFDYAIYGIFICSIIVSFSKTIYLYESGGFDTPIGWMNNHWTEHWFGKGFFNLALFATLAAESAFSVGLWGLYEAYRTEHKFPGLRYFWTWGMFIGGLVIIGWSNISATLGSNYLFGNPIKGLVLGLSVPYFVLNSVLVLFSRSQSEETETNEQPEQPKLTLWAASLGNAVNTFKSITQTPEHPKQEQSKSSVQNTPLVHEHSENVKDVQSEPKQITQDEEEHSEQSQTKPHVHVQEERWIVEKENDPEHVQEEQDVHLQDEESVSKQSVHVQGEQRKGEQRKRKSKAYLYIVNGSKTEQAVQCAIAMMERNEPFSVRKLAQVAGCSTTTAQNAMNRLREQKHS